MPAQKSFFQLIEERKPTREILWAPCIYDCVSANVAEQIGFQACTISSMEQTFSFAGVPCGLMNFEEMLISAERICNSTNMAVMVDGEHLGGTPMAVYRNAKRFAEAGAMAISVEDTDVQAIGDNSMVGRDSRLILNDFFLSAELLATNVMAALEGVKGTDCMIVARTDCKGGGAERFKHRDQEYMLGLDEAIRRMQMCVEAGAPMTMIQNLCYRGGRHEWEEVAKRVPGMLCYADIHADFGQSDVDDVQELYDLGYQLITCHCFMKGAVSGMYKYGKSVFDNQNTVFTENDPLPVAGAMGMNFDDWGAREDRYKEFYKRMQNYKGR